MQGRLHACGAASSLRTDQIGCRVLGFRVYYDLQYGRPQKGTPGVGKPHVGMSKQYSLSLNPLNPKVLRVMQGYLVYPIWRGP